MKRIIVIAIHFSLVFLSIDLNAQSEAGIKASQSAHVADKMKDSLGLTAVQRDSVLNINVWLHEQKSVIWQRYTSKDSLRLHLQRIENSRDSLYQRILTAQQFELYRQKKVRLVSRNQAPTTNN